MSSSRASIRWRSFLWFALLLVPGGVGCGGPEQQDSSTISDIEGTVNLDGSSTVHPVASAAVDGFQKTYPKVEVIVGNHGTSGGFQKFASGEIDIANASLPIKFPEIEKCRANNVKFIELAIGYDGLTVVANKKNEWLNALTIEQLKKIFGEENPPKKWNEVDPSWPDQDIKLYIPGASSGTLEYFKEVVVGKGKGLRADVDASEEDNVLVTGVAGNEFSLGFFGAAYYLENQDKLKAIRIVNPTTKAEVSPTKEAIASGEYAPFSRPLFMYVNHKSAEEKVVVRLFLSYLLGEGRRHVAQVGYVNLPDELYQRSLQRLEKRLTGTSFHKADGEKLVGPLSALYNPDQLLE